jgi:predicted amidophosphoribosyltransferase
MVWDVINTSLQSTISLGSSSEALIIQKHLLCQRGISLGFVEVFEKLKKNKWVWAIYIPLTIPVNVFLALSGNCLALIMVGLLTFGIPYLFGVRSIRTFLLVGIVIILITGIIYGALYTYFMYNQTYYPYFEDRFVDDTELMDGIALPYRGNDTTSFNYTVTYTGIESPVNITVYANITDLQGEFEKSIPLINAGSLYYNETVLDKDIYAYHFALYDNNSKTWTETEIGFGPVTIPFTDLLVAQTFYGIISIFLNSGIFFFMFIALYYWRKSAQDQKEKWSEEMKTAEKTKEKSREQKAKKEEGQEKGEFTCNSCDATVDSDAEKCWNCGEEFTGEEEDEEEDKEEGEEDKKEEPIEEFECTSCGADVNSEATVCPNCGEPFDDDEEDEKEGEKEGVKEEFTCTSCGADVSADANFCPNCGEPFEDDEEDGDEVKRDSKTKSDS